MTTRQFTLTGTVDDDEFAAYLNTLYDPKYGDLKPEGCEEATFADFAAMVLEYASNEFCHTPLTFELTIEDVARKVAAL